MLIRFKFKMKSFVSALITAIASAHLMEKTGNLASGVSSSKVSLGFDYADTLVTIYPKLEMVMTSALASGDEVAEFFCYQKTANLWECAMAHLAVTTTALFTLGTWSSTTVPAEGDFTSDKAFDVTTGFSAAKYTSVWK